MRRPCPSPLPSAATTTSCSTSTVASGSATSRSTGAADADRRAARGGQVGPVSHQRRAPAPGGVRAQAVAARVPGVARRGPERGRGGPVRAGRAQRRPRQCVRRRLAGARSTTSPRPACGSSTTHRSPPAPTSWSSPRHDDLVFDELRVATQAVLRGAELIGATRDSSFPMPDGQWPGTGAVLAAIETATGITRLADRRQARGADVRRRPRPPRPRPHARGRRPARHRHRRRPPRRPRLRARAHRRHDPRGGRRRRPPARRTSPTRSAALVLAASH